jgi:tRNA(fMet)-specific endonuclease VapC
MATLIDSSVLIAAERRKLDLRSKLSERPEEDFAIAAITASELLHGVHRADTPERRTRREAIVEQLLATIPVIPFDLLAARLHARIWAQLAAKGVHIGAHDLIIGATALAVGRTVATHDLRSFPKIPGLSIARW